MTAQAVKKSLKAYASAPRRIRVMSFAKTGPGGYAEGDVYIGVYVPDMRAVANKYRDLAQAEIRRLLTSPVHEERYTALLILVGQFSNGRDQKKIYNFYMEHLEHINGWDLVDASAPHIPGAYLHTRSKKPLYRLAKSSSLWERRIAMVSCWHFIRNDVHDTALDIAEILVYDNHDLIHKAVGWMLREVGKKDAGALKGFLNLYAPTMPRTALRYAIERFPERERRKYLRMKAD